MKMNLFSGVRLSLRGLMLLVLPVFADAGMVDGIQFGDPASEELHGFKADLSRVVEGGLGEPARQLLPPEETGWRGGRMTFTARVDPERPNYFTAKFWGGDQASTNEVESRIFLFIDGKQVGQRQLGEVETLDIMQSKMPRYPGRFFYKTIPLPMNMTQGKQEVELAIEAQGGFNAYRKTVEQFQRMMTEPSRGIYRGYVHTEPCFVPAEDDRQGTAPPDFPVRSGPGPEVLEKLKLMLNETSSQLIDEGPVNKLEAMQYLAHAYHTPWNTAYKNPEVLQRITEGMDRHYLNWKDDPKTIVGMRWVHKGPAGDAVRLLADDLGAYLNEPVEGTRTLRRRAWAEMLIASRDYSAGRRRSYTNQSMIMDLNIYYCNLAARLLGSSKAWPEKKARLLFYESAGLKPWSGNWDPNGKPDWSQGESKLLLTEKGLSKELGYVGGYGEIIQDLVKMMYDLTKLSPEAEGDPHLKKQLVKMVRARAPFRYPLADDEGFRSMNLESVIGWRDWKTPGRVMYDQLNGREGGSLDAAAATRDPAVIGYAQQMLEDNQFFAALKKRMADQKTAAKTWLLPVPENYELIESLPASSFRLPMSPGQPDFVFADTQDGVIALKNGDDILYTSLYWRARVAVNSLARVHYLTPAMERDATVNIEIRFKHSGHFYTVPDHTNVGFGKGRAEEYYRDRGLHLAAAGLQQPIAEVPASDETYEVGRENLHAGKGDLYLMSYGNYFFAMNCTEKESFRFDLPEAFIGSTDLVSGQRCGMPNVSISPGQTIVFYREKE